MLCDDAVVLEVSQPAGEDVRADPREAVEQVGEALWPEKQLAHDERRPALAHYVERARHWAALTVSLHDRDDRGYCWYTSCYLLITSSVNREENEGNLAK